MKNRRFHRPRPRPDSVDKTPFEVTIDKLSHDGRGLARHRGKTLFVAGALPGETVQARYLKQRGKFDEARTLAVISPSPQRTEPQCRHFHQCGGCELQHLDAAAQLDHKQQQALDQLQRIGGLSPERILPPLDSEPWNYRRRSRLAVYCPRKQSQPMLGYRQRQSKQLVDIQACPILDPRAEAVLPALHQWINDANRPQAVSHLEFTAGDADAALIARHPQPLDAADLAALQQLAEQHRLLLFLQPAGPESLHPVGHGLDRLHYQLPEFDLTLAFDPRDFTQINAAVNRQMVERALQLLEPVVSDRILDLYCGLGNFSLPLATRAGEVVGVEGAATMVERAEQNARHNGLNNCHFHTLDLTRDFRGQPWYRSGFDKVLLDPPRAGAAEAVALLAETRPERILYISCDPATFARDAGLLAGKGYRLRDWGVMNMFPQTTHVESIGLFTP